ncbi:MAG: T9SS type A sorting domain-containing protein [Bacteroidota bacterium]
MRKNYSTLAILFVVFLTLFSSLPAQTRDGNFWIPNNTVNKIIVDDARGVILIGGGFDYIGPYAGSSLMLNKTTGVYDQTFPTVNGNVSSAVSDGSGGLFIGGNFTTVGGISRNNLAHITSTGTVSSWNPNPNGDISALVVDNGMLYVGGAFTSIDGHGDTCLAAFDVSTKTYDTTFQPDGLSDSFSARVNQLCVYGSKLYFSGSFTNVGNASRNQLAAVDKTTGAIDAWDPAPSHWSDPMFLNIAAIVPDNGSLIVGGNFTTIGSLNRRSIAKIDTAAGSAMSWNADISPYIVTSMFSSDTSASVQAFYVKGDTLYVGGNFQGFQSQTSYGVAALNASTGTFLTGAVPYTEAHSGIDAFSSDGTTLYIGGSYFTLGGQQRRNLSAVNASTGAVLTWNPTVSDAVEVIISSGSQLYIGGYFYGANGVVRYGLAAIDQTTGIPTSWDPNNGTTDLQTSINAMTLVDSVLYVGGRFNNFASQARTGLAAVGVTGGALLPFNPVLSKYQIFSGPGDPEVFTATHNENKLYIGGNVDTINGSQRNGAAAFNLSDGSLSPWNPNLTQSGEGGSVEALAIAGDKVYIGGASFDMAGDSARTNIAAVDTGNASVRSWYPVVNSISDHIYALTVDGSTLYVGGSFNQIGGVSRNYFAAFDTSNSTPTSWNPDADSSPGPIEVSSSYVYLGGFFQTVGGTTRRSIAAVDKITGTLSSWDPQIDAGNYMEAIAISPTYHKVYFGGGFNTVIGDFSQYFAAVSNPFDASLPVELASFSASARQQSIELLWGTATEVNNHGFEIERKSMGNEQWTINKWSKIGFVEGNGTSNTPKQYSFSDITCLPGKYSYRLKQIDHDGRFEYSQEVEVTTAVAPKEFALEQNYPNPFNPTTTIGFTLQKSGYTTLKVYDAIGREVVSLVDGYLDAGPHHQRTFDATALASGMYFARLASGGNVQVKKLMLLK